MDNSNLTYVALQCILIVVYGTVGVRSLLLAHKMKWKSWLSHRRRDLLYMIWGTTFLFILAEVCMLLKVEELFIWFFFDLSMAFVYHQFYETIDKDNNPGHK